MPLSRANAGRLVLTAIALTGCGRCSSGRAATDGAPAASGSAAAPPASFEVEFDGHLRSDLPAARHVVIVTSEPCTPDNLATVPTIAIGEARVRSGALHFWTEGNVREGGRGHVCALALDAAGQAIGFGALARNPLLFAAGGKDDLEFEGLDIAVTALVPPRPLPPHRF